MTMIQSAVVPYVTILIFVAESVGHPPPGRGQYHISKSTTAGHELEISSFGKMNHNCEGIYQPKLYLDQAPEHGTICLRRETDRQRCTNEILSEVYVIYQPHAGYVGADKFRYTLRYPSIWHTFDMDLTVAPDHPPSDGAHESVAGPADKNAQPVGSIPECSALVS